MHHKNLNLSFFCVMIITTAVQLEALVIALNSMSGDENMDIPSVVAIIIACIGVIGSVVGVIVQSKKQGDITVDVHTDTQAMRPKVDNIDESTRKIKDVVIERLVPEINDLHKIQKQIDFIEDDIKYHKRLKDEMPLSFNSKDYFLDGIEKLYEINSHLNTEKAKLEVELCKVREENDLLKQRVKALEKSITHKSNNQI